MEGSSNLSNPIKPPIMPANVRAGQVLGLVEITGGLGTSIDFAKLCR